MHLIIPWEWTASFIGCSGDVDLEVLHWILIATLATCFTQIAWVNRNILLLRDKNGDIYARTRDKEPEETAWWLSVWSSTPVYRRRPYKMCSRCVLFLILPVKARRPAGQQGFCGGSHWQSFFDARSLNLLYLNFTKFPVSFLLWVPRDQSRHVDLFAEALRFWLIWLWFGFSLIDTRLNAATVNLRCVSQQHGNKRQLVSNKTILWTICQDCVFFFFFFFVFNRWVLNFF